MKFIRSLCLPLAFALLFCGNVPADNEPDPGPICASVGRLLEQVHYSRHKLDPALAQQFLDNYLETLDYNKLFFTQKDVDQFRAKYGPSLNDDILLGNVNPALEIWDIYIKRVEDRLAKVKGLLHEKYAFNEDKMIELDRRKSPWPKDEDQAGQLWHDRIEGEILQERLNKNPKDLKLDKKGSPGSVSENGALTDPVKIVAHRYEQILRNIHEQTHDDAVKIYLSTLAQTYDPHSEYLSKSDLDNFDIQMKLSLFGIGAELRPEDGYATITQLVPGGPAQKNGQLKVNDRISGVAQGNHDFVDVVDMKLDKVVELIRGPKGTTVRLQVLSAHGTDPAKRKIVQIVRDQIQLKDQAANAEIIDKEDASGQSHRLGWITLPSFYADMEHAGAQGARSTTHDVLVLLNRLKQENIEGLVVDLRRNGGGSLDEAVNLTGLFVKKGPVVQAKDSNGGIHVSRDKDTTVAYDGPLIVLTNRLSASASEIFAAALQDYGRAVIVGGESTFGKGTVQTMVPISRVIPFLGDGNDAGALKLTIQKFYRVAGGSTQLRGVLSDVRLPSLFDHPDLGEAALKNPMKYDEVDPASYDKVTDHPLFLSELRKRSGERVAANQEFAYITEDLNRTKQKLADNKISLNEHVRREELAADKAREDARTAERAKEKVPGEKRYEVTLDNVDQPALQLAKDEQPPAAGTKPAAGNKDKKAKAADTTAAAPAEDDADEDAPAAKPEAIDPVRSETLNILGDLIDLSHWQQTADAKTAK